MHRKDESNGRADRENAAPRARLGPPIAVFIEGMAARSFAVRLCFNL